MDGVRKLVSRFVDAAPRARDRLGALVAVGGLGSGKPHFLSGLLRGEGLAAGRAESVPLLFALGVHSLDVLGAAATRRRMWGARR